MPSSPLASAVSSSAPAGTPAASSASAAPHPAAPHPIWDIAIPAGTHWSGVVRRGVSLKIVDVEGGANLAALFYFRDNPLERYNMADTLKAQHTARLTRGHVLYTDMGRILCSIVEDTLGWHDPIGGLSDEASNNRKYALDPRHPTARYQQKRNEMVRNGRENMIIELGKHGLGSRDLVANVNFFSKVSIGDDGALRFATGHSTPGSSIVLRFEMDTLAVFSTAPHPLDPSPLYSPHPVAISAFRGPPPGPDDVCRTFCPENTRGFINTDMLYA